MQRSKLFLLLLTGSLVIASARARGQFLPTDVGTTVNGFQDDFDQATLKPDWVVSGQDAFTIGNGVLHVSTVGGDPNHLLFSRAGYNGSVQEVLARIRINDFGTGDPSRAGVAVGVDPGSGQGLNLLFRDEPSPGDRHVAFLDDLRSWGPQLAITWQNNQWYWLRLRQERDASGNSNDVFGKLWRADGSEPEPADWQVTYDYAPERSLRTGLAGITGTSSGGLAELDVDYILIKAAGLPSIVVAPQAVLQSPVAITSQPQSQTHQEGSPVLFTVTAVGNPGPSYQWYRNDAAIAGATNASYALPAVSLSDNDASFQVIVQNVVSNVTRTAASDRVRLTVQADLTAPALIAVQAMGLAQVQVSFSEPVAARSATNTANYLLRAGPKTVNIASAGLDDSLTNVVLNVAALQQGLTYTLTINGVTDVSSAANSLAPNTTAQFTALSFAPAPLGNPQPAGTVTSVPGGLDIVAGGRGLGGSADEAQFIYQDRTGDFDVKVRVTALAAADPWTEAGLMARASLDPGAPEAGVLATPTISGAFFLSRTAVNASASAAGAFPVNYPNTWLRLRRAGSDFTGYAGRDGGHWTLLSTANPGLPATVLLGFAVASHEANQSATAQLRDFADVAATAPAASQSHYEPLGQCSRLTSLVISEIMFHPAPRTDEKQLEFIELFNSLATPEDLSGYRLSGDVDYVFPAGTVMAGGGFLVVARNPADLESVYGLTGVLGPFTKTNNLPNNKGTVRLRSPAGAIFLEVQYRNDAPWPLAADGAGHSIVLAHPSYGENDPRAWTASDVIGGSPGRLDPVTPSPMRAVVINELLAHTDDPQPDFIELYNHSNQAVDLSGCVLTDDAITNKFVIPPNTLIQPRGFLVFDQTQLHFSLNAAGETVYFKDPTSIRVLDTVRFGGQENRVAIGRYPDGAEQWSRLENTTPGQANAPARASDVVINELMYAPISGNDDDQYVELINRSAAAIDLSGWRLEDGVEFTFPDQTVLFPDGYLVVAKNAAGLLTLYTNLSSANTLGNFTGKLAGGGERIALTKPDTIVSTNSQGVVSTNLIHIVVDEVAYYTGGRWGQWSHGGGSSLERVDPRADGRLAASWADSDETTKAPWTTVVVTGRLDNGTVAADQLQVLLQGAGECLIDDVQVLNAQGVNQTSNPGFETDAAGWVAEGTEDRSSWEPGEGFQSAHSYHVRAVDRGDNEVNRVRTGLRNSLAANTTATIQAKVRWLKGQASVLFRLRGCWLEAVGDMELPRNAGTPGARNSRAVLNAPPAIFDVTHAPVLPAAGEPVVVTARVSDPDGVASAAVNYRLDPGGTYVSVPMRDDGTGGDPVAGDGVYGGTIPGQPDGALVAFSVLARDQAQTPASASFPADAPARECLIRFGETTPSGNFPVYRFWITQATFNTWTGRNKMNNTPLDVTFVIGSDRVIYNTLALYAGSPYIAPGYSTPSGNRCGYSVTFPADNRFLGNSDLVLDWPGGHGNENTALQEEMGYWIANKMGLPYSHRYPIRLHVNGVTDMKRGTVFEAVNQPAGDFVRAWSPDAPTGDFYKIERAFEFSDSGGLITDPEPRLENYTTVGGAKKTARYRWNWVKRSTDAINDYTNIFELVDAVNAAAPEPYTSQTEALVDIEEWMGMLATEHIIVNFDAYGHEIGKNMYAYKPDNGKWQLYMFDLDWLMLAAPAHRSAYAPSTAPLFNADDPLMVRMFNHPPFLRAYYRAVKRAVDGPLLSADCDPVMDAKYQALVANGVTLCDGQTLANPAAVKNWFSQRRAALARQLDTLRVDFAITSGTDFSTNAGVVTVVGSAPIEVKNLHVNGRDYPVTWTTVTNWAVRLALPPGRSAFAFQAIDVAGNVLTNGSASAAITYTGSAESPVGKVVINEMMYRPAVPGAEFIELFNNSAASAFDLSGWRLEGVDFTFPQGSVIAPGGYVVIGRNQAAFISAYGNGIPLAGEFAGKLSPAGETLRLVRPGQSPTDDLVVSTVTYSASAPWPVVDLGSSLQLIDPGQENSRVANWAASTSSAPTNSAPQWQKVTATGTASSSRLYVYLDSPGDVHLDDLKLVAGETADVGPNLIPNGDFEAGFPTPWTVSANLSESTLDSAVKHSGASSLHVISSSAGTTQGSSIWQDIGPLVTDVTYTLSYWYLPSTNGPSLTIRLSGSGISSTRSIAPVTNPILASTPGALNSARADLPSIPALWINECEPHNVAGMVDNFGEHEPWVEICNSGAAAVSLDGLFLTDDYAALTKWSFRAGVTVGSKQFLLVWLDGQPEQAAAAALHTSFRTASATGAIALVMPFGGQPAVLDYLSYNVLSADRSVGLFPDGQPGTTQVFYTVTPGAANDDAAAPLPIWINEWMAADASALADPADGHFDDWLELFNPNSVAVDLSGYSLATNLTNRTAQWPIPAGTTLPSRGYLLVWADNEPGQNGGAGGDLHTPFKLNRAGESIGLFEPNGRLLDSITYGLQTNNASQGRWPDGGPNVYFMPQPTPRAANVLPGSNPNVQILTVALEAGALNFTWQAQPGQSYRVQYKDDLTATSWADLAAVTATLSIARASSLINAAPHRFYRIAVGSSAP